MKIAKKIIAVLIIIMIIFGMFMMVKKGINTGLIYTEKEQIRINLNSQFEVSDIRKIASEVFGNNDYIIQKADIFEDTVVIKNKDITDEQKQTIVEKINQQYNLGIKTEEIEIEKVGAINFKEDLKKYILPFIITLVLIVIYFAIRFRNLGIARTIIRFITTIIMVELIYISLISISQIEIGRLFAPMAFMLYMLVILASTVVFEKERGNLSFNNNK